MNYTELSIEEWATLQIGLTNCLRLRANAQLLERSPSTISREVKRNSNAAGQYIAPQAQQSWYRHRLLCRPKKKLAPDSELFERVVYMLKHKFSPQQIAGKLRTMNILGYEHTYVCRETIYSAIYALPVGELRKELIICLRQGKSTLRPRTGCVDRRGQYPTWSAFTCVHQRLKIDWCPSTGRRFN